MKGTNELRADISVFGRALAAPFLGAWCSTPEFLRPNSAQVLPPRSASCAPNTQTLISYSILDQDSISNDQDLKPYWNPSCEAMQPQLWLPQKTASAAQESNYCNKYATDSTHKSKHLIAEFIPKAETHSALNISLHISLPSVIPTVAAAPPSGGQATQATQAPPKKPPSAKAVKKAKEREGKAITTAKIRFFPSEEQEALLRDCCDSARAVYNEMIAALRADDDRAAVFTNQITKTRPPGMSKRAHAANNASLKAQALAARQITKPSHMFALRRDAAARVFSLYASGGAAPNRGPVAIPKNHLGMSAEDVFKTRKAVLARRKDGKPADYNFRYKEDPVQGFLFQRLNPSNIEMLGHITEAEKIPREAMHCMARVVCDRGEWYLLAQKLVDLVPLKDPESQGLEVVAIDPGVRCFLTGYSPNGLVEIGNLFADRVLKDIGLKISALCSERAKYANLPADQKETTWFKQRLAGIERRLAALRTRRKNLIHDLHKRAAHFLVTTYDIILMPKLGVKAMSKRRPGRKLRRSVVARMMDLCHHKFRMMLIYMAKKRGKHLIFVNEAYTSKTKSWSGEIVHGLGGAAMIKEKDFVVNRDHNGARGILLRALSAA